MKLKTMSLALRKYINFFKSIFEMFLFFSPTPTTSMTTLRNVNLDGKIHRTPASDFIKVVVPTKAIVKWVSF